MKTKLKSFLKQGKISRLGLGYFVITLTPFILYFLKFPFSPGRDWNYFNSLGLIIGDSLSRLKLPLLDPWVCGGIDILANPQSWLFSPFIILNLLLAPYLANLVSLLVCAFIGFQGMIKITMHLEDKSERYLFSMLFTLSPFFFLHFAEGHIPYRTFYFLPWIFYFSDSFSSLRKLWWLLLIMTIMFLDGGIYPFYYSVFLILFNLNYMNFVSVVINKRNRKNILILLSGVCFLLLTKVIPVLFIHQARVPENEIFEYSFNNILQSFFDPRQSNFYTMAGQKYFMHEYAHYIGIGFSLLFFSLLPKIKKHTKLVIQLFLFTWITLGYGGEYNPWTIIKSIPFINHIHIQSRFLILSFLIALVMIIRTYESSKYRKIFLYLAVIEFAGVAFYINSHAFISHYNSKLIVYASTTSKPVSQYQNYIPKPDVYNSKNISYQCYEPANPKRLAPTLDFLLLDKTKTKADVVITSETINIHSRIPLTEKFVINYQWNGGWDCEAGCSTAIPNNGLIQISPIGDQDVVIRYNPVYWQLSLACFFIGMFLMGAARQRFDDDIQL